MSTRSRRLLWGITAAMALYALSYLVLTVLGRYEPIEWGLRGVKRYEWAPRGFVHDLKWRMPMVCAFLPFWELDRFFWHSEERLYGGHLPING